jgi:subtilisin family serine protease
MSKKVFHVISLLLALVFIVSVTQPAYTSNAGKMRVWVEFSPGRGARVEKSLNALGAAFHYRFEDLNSFVVTVPEQALNGLRNNPNVVSIEEDAIRYPAAQEVPYGIGLVQARDVWDANRDNVLDTGAPTGAGIKVCIIDSGLWTGHEDFAGVSVSGDVTGWNNDTCGHGTHVAGTIAASFNYFGVVGVNPGGENSVALHIVKVFDGPECGWSYSSTLANAANICQAAGADIISMSLGGAQKNKQEERAFNNLYAAGILSIAAAGNDGISAYNYPASYSSVVSVAAIDSNMNWADFSQFNNQVELAAPGVGVLSTVPFLNKASIMVDGTTYNGHPVEFAALVTAYGPLADGGLCAATGDWVGQVVLCQRGDISFLDKVMNVQNSGGTAAVIYNNEPGDLLATLGEGTSTIPAIGITQQDGNTLLGKINHPAKVESSFEQNVSAYEAWDGTSMATPHVSGVAALIWSAFPNLSNVQIRNALTASALDLGAEGRDVYYGFGLVQAKDALLSLGWNPLPTSTPPTPTPTNPPTATPTTPTPTNTPTATATTPPPTPTSTVTVVPGGTIALSVTTDKAVYSNNQTVYITVVTNDNNAPLGGVTISGQIISPSNKTVASFSGTTGSTGQLTFTYRVKRNVGTGLYTINTTATKQGFTAATFSTHFTVQ